MRAGNPVLRREVVERWRSRRATITLTLYLAVLGAIMYLLYRVGIAVLNSQFGFGFDAASAGPVLGRFLVEGLLFFVLLLVLFVGPGYAAAQISGERERRTLTLLQVTLLRPIQIVMGKLGAAVAWMTLLVLAAVPLGAVAFFLGGIGIVDLLRSGLLLVVTGISIAGIGLGVSSLTRKTTGSIVLTYGVVLMLVLGTFFLAGVELVFRSTRGQEIRTPIALYFNPFFGLADAVNATRVSGAAFGGLPSPLGIIAEALPGAPAMGGFDQGFVDGGGGVMTVPAVPPPGVLRADPEVLEGVVAEDGEILVEEGQPVPLPAPAPDFGPVPQVFQPEGAGTRPVWLIVMGIYAVLGALGVLIATRRLGVTEPRSRGVPTVPALTGAAAPGAPGAAAGGGAPGAWEGPP